MGKLGGAEINYGSDLDILFVTNAGAGELPGLQRIAVEVMEMLSSRTELGVAFATDVRLRPDGPRCVDIPAVLAASARLGLLRRTLLPPGSTV